MFINLPTSFPEDKFKEFGRLASVFFPKVLSEEDLNDPLQRRLQFERSWVAVMYRYRACADYNDDFKALVLGASDLWREWGADEELNYKLEQYLYGFFMNGLSIFESFGFCLYFVGAAQQFMNFLYVCEPRNINLEKTTRAFCNAFPHLSIATRLDALVKGKDYKLIKSVRNILAHRLAASPYVHGYGITHQDGTHTCTKEEGWYFPGLKDEIDEELTQRFMELTQQIGETTQRFLDEINSLLTSLLEASVEFVQKSKPAKASGKT